MLSVFKRSQPSSIVPIIITIKTRKRSLETFCTLKDGNSAIPEVCFLLFNGMNCRSDTQRWEHCHVGWHIHGQKCQYDQLLYQSDEDQCSTLKDQFLENCDRNTCRIAIRKQYYITILMKVMKGGHTNL